MIGGMMDRFYRIEVPLPNDPLKELNSCVIKRTERNLIIETGFNRTVCLEAMQEGIRALDIDLAVTDTPKSTGSPGKSPSRLSTVTRASNTARGGFPN